MHQYQEPLGHRFDQQFKQDLQNTEQLGGAWWYNDASLLRSDKKKKSRLFSEPVVDQAG